MRAAVFACAAVACSSPHAGAPGDAAPNDASSIDTSDGALAPDAAACTTRITYGAAWIKPSGHTSQYDDATGAVTWDGTCTDDGANSYATLSNGWKPYFTGHSACVLALDEHACGETDTCTTRITYGSSWLAPSGHPNDYDVVTGRVFGDQPDDSCDGSTFANLSNGWQPHFSGSTCPLSFEYTQCSGLYTNSLLPACADPGVLHDGGDYYATCTSGNAAAAFPIYHSTDLATWTADGHIFPSGMRPSWAVSDFWAPEIHKIGSGYVAYFAARGSDGKLAIGAASAASATGPFTDLGHPLLHDANMGLIDPSEFTDTDGTPYLLWKEDGNAVGMPTPIHSQPLAADGLSLTGSPATLVTNDQSWEGAVTEAPWMVSHGGMYYLFYSGNSYANATYAVGVARGASPHAAMTKPAGPIVVTDNAWVGPGHCSVVDAPGGVTAMVYHAWATGCVNTAGCNRELLVDEVQWGSDGWPSVPLAPSITTRPLP